MLSAISGSPYRPIPRSPRQRCPLAMTTRESGLGGWIEAGLHILPLRAYYEDTDFSGAVYHANYLKFCERGRSDMLRLVGIDQRARWDADGLAFVVTSLSCSFLRPARIGDIIRVETRLEGMTGARLDIEQRILREAARLFEARVTVALVGRGGRP